MKKLLSLLLVMMLLIGCSALAEAAPVENAIVITDDLGRTVEIAGIPEKIVSLTPSTTEILFALGAGDRVIGIDASSDYPEDVQGIDIVGDYMGPNLEAIIAAEPDVVFASTYLTEEQISSMADNGITVVCAQKDNYDEIEDGIRMVAEVIGEDADALIAAMEDQKAAAIAAVTPRDNPLKVYYSVSFGEYGDYTAGPGTFIDALITLAGGQNVVTGTDNPWPSYSIEQLILDDPDVILISDYIGDRTTLVEQLSASEGYKELRAVQEGHVYCVDDDTANRPGPRIYEALTDLVEIFNTVE